MEVIYNISWLQTAFLHIKHLWYYRQNSWHILDIPTKCWAHHPTDISPSIQSYFLFKVDHFLKPVNRQFQHFPRLKAMFGSANHQSYPTLWLTSDISLISSQNSQETETIINFQLWFMQSAWLGGPSSINWAITYLPWQGLSHRKCCLVLGLSTGKETRIHSSSLQLWYCWVSVGSLTGRLYLCNLLKIAEIDLLKYIKATREIYFVITTKNCK